MSTYFDEELIEEIKERNPIIDVVSRYVPLKKSGSTYKGLCPFHHEKTPSFVVSEEKQFYHCFGCGKSGDAIQFVMQMEHIDFIDAIHMLGDWAGISIEEHATSDRQREEIHIKNQLYEINREAALFYYKNLFQTGNIGLNYLHERGLNIQTIKKFGLGYAKNQWELLNRYLLSKGYDQKLIYKAGLVIKRKTKDGYYDRFRNRVIFPIINVSGKVIGFGGRIIDEGEPKYLNSPETPVFNKGNHLYGLNLSKDEIRKKKQIIVVEGYMDVIGLYEGGIYNAVASLGTALTKSQGYLLKRYADEVMIAYDGDTAGKAATLRGLDVLKDVGCKVKVVDLSDGVDPDEYVRKKGRDAFLEEIQKALPLVDYKIKLAHNENDMTTTEGKIKFVQSITSILKTLKSPVEIDAYIQKIASASHISPEAIKSEIYGNNKGNYQKDNPSYKNKYRSKNDRYTNKYDIKPVKPIQKMGYIEAERSLLKLMMDDKRLFDKIKNMMSCEDFIDDIHIKIAKVIEGLYETNEFVSIEMIVGQFNEEEISILHDIYKKVVPIENIDKAFIDYMDVIKKHKLTTRKTEIENELKEIEKMKDKTPNQIVRIRELCIDYEKLLKELKKQ
ncbi:DNA primase [Inediibacterium massiliense]|uniref:DNA primase n=1 Tax=Inediibacterium massiliense TaxID=1658111 RepID=UPI0006B58822|nr:DNA primase [Inediibacterium massiliense]